MMCSLMIPELRVSRQITHTKTQIKCSANTFCPLAHYNIMVIHGIIIFQARESYNYLQLVIWYFSSNSLIL